MTPRVVSPRRRPIRFCWTCGLRYRGLGLQCLKCPPMRRPYPPRAPLAHRRTRNDRPHGPDGRFLPKVAA